MSKEELHYLDVRRVLREKNPKLAKKIPGFVYWLLERLIHQKKLNYYIEKVHKTRSIDYFNKIIEVADIKLNVEGFEKLDPNKKYIFVSNHPLGGIDGCAIITVLAQKFNDNIRAFVNDILMEMKYADPIFLPINKHGANSKKYAQLGENAYDSGKQILIFPAGLVSRKQKGIVCDPLWKKNFVKKAVDKERDVVPIYFEGKNSRLFYFLTKLRKALGIKFNIEMILLADEFKYHERNTFTIKFGKPIAYSSFDKKVCSYNEWAKKIQIDTYKLGGKDISGLNLKNLI
jgi:putative hemolysin